MKDREKKDTNTIKYWQNRAVARFENQEQQSLSYIHRIKNAYTDAEIRTIREIKKLYANYYHNDKTFDKFALQDIEPNGNIARFKAEMERLGLNQYLPENYDFRMTRLEMLNNQIWAELKKAGIEQNNLTANSVINTINNSYNQAIFDTEKHFGSLLTFSKLDSRTVQEILNYKIEGKHFSNRIWTNTDILAEQINSKIATAVAIGQSPEKTIREVRERFDVGRFYAERLVRTESAFYHNSAELRAYQELGVEKYRIIATLDNRTSNICQHKDHKVFKISEAKQGVNFPPFHPLCRTTTAAYFGEELEPETRIARDPKTGKSYEILNMSYLEWANTVGIKPAVPKDIPKISPVEKREPSLRDVNNIVRKTGKKPVFKQDHTKIQKLVEDLGRIDSRVAKNIHNLIVGKSKVAEITSMNKYEIMKYSEMLRVKSIPPRVVLSQNAFRHMINSGHITGVGKNGRVDNLPMTAQDLANIKDLIKKPDVVSESNRENKKRLKFEKTIDNKQRLILELSEKDGRFEVLTMFNVS